MPASNPAHWALLECRSTTDPENPAQSSDCATGCLRITTKLALGRCVNNKRQAPLHPTQIEHRIDLPDQMIRRHHPVEFKRIKELALSTLSSPHHGHRSRDSSSHPDGSMVHPTLNESFATHSPCRPPRVIAVGPEKCRSRRSTRANYRGTPVSYRTRFAEILAKDRPNYLDSFLSFHQLYSVCCVT